MTSKRLTGILLIIVPVVFMSLFSLLGVTFNYPTILREPTDTVLTAYQQGGLTLVLNWYGMALSAFLLIPLAILVHKNLKTAAQDNPVLLIATMFGVLAGAVQFLGFIRWPFMVGYLANTYLNPAATSTTRESVDLIFQSFNYYAGVSVGENMGYLLTALWTILIAVTLFRTARLWSILGIISGVGILLGILEPFGIEAVGMVSAIAYMAWAVWLVGVGIYVLRRIPQPAVNTLSAPRKAVA
ncbi:MAG: DUF4386 domain-containing protein [Chloroflexi bacterium]|nr:DUF4386 domain-containing protein [Chloroflexota bacterium]MCC6895254.1 DUF4386 domain-containing protein [Anaerolineae bacterium]